MPPPERKRIGEEEQDYTFELAGWSSSSASGAARPKGVEMPPPKRMCIGEKEDGYTLDAARGTLQESYANFARDLHSYAESKVLVCISLKGGESVVGVIKGYDDELNFVIEEHGTIWETMYADKRMNLHDRMLIMRDAWVTFWKHVTQPSQMLVPGPSPGQ